MSTVPSIWCHFDLSWDPAPSSVDRAFRPVMSTMMASECSGARSSCPRCAFVSYGQTETFSRSAHPLATSNVSLVLTWSCLGKAYWRQAWIYLVASTMKEHFAMVKVFLDVGKAVLSPFFLPRARHQTMLPLKRNTKLPMNLQLYRTHNQTRRTKPPSKQWRWEWGRINSDTERGSGLKATITSIGECWW